MCYTQAVAKVQVSAYPAFEAFRSRHSKDLGARSFQTSLVERVASIGPIERKAIPLVEAVHFLDTA